MNIHVGVVTRSEERGEWRMWWLGKSVEAAHTGTITVQKCVLLNTELGLELVRWVWTSLSLAAEEQDDVQIGDNDVAASGETCLSGESSEGGDGSRRLLI
jgi:hypothetical protein